MPRRERCFVESRVCPPTLNAGPALYMTPFFASGSQFPGFSRQRAAGVTLQKTLTAALHLSYAKGLTALFRAQNLHVQAGQFRIKAEGASRAFCP
ncbi:hypothetical protein N7373_08700 [Achromobacter mucicolens]|uniref:hypothetical protein n=1 Tax=Achromobacter mucicolens TaxID=1389922 RepID=UPI00244AD9DA|nr:hypothetical protein [Achromobacter mucicolens]MDH0091518.1 hypothetical protein [Achromobacter mucicolens]